MSKCSCGNTEGLKFMEGTKKSTGKRWKGLKCPVCNGMTWVPVDTICVEEMEYKRKEVVPVKDEMTPDMWHEKEMRDHRRKILLALVMNKPDATLSSLIIDADKILRYVNEGSGQSS